MVLSLGLIRHNPLLADDGAGQPDPELTKRQVPELMRDIFGLQMSVGTVIGCQEAASAAIAQTVEDARSYAQQQPVKHADETGWREGVGRSRAWLWTVVTTHVVV
ncbi:MAG: transposase, partial [Byssovorax sp.]